MEPTPKLRWRWGGRALTAAAVAVVLWFYHWTVKSAWGYDSWGESDYYNLLVQGYRQGHLYLNKQPSPELLALADPYDPAQNGPHRLPDTSYFRGHYYLYFGAAPAVALMWPYAAITGREMLTGVAVMIFVSVAFLAATGLWLAVRRRYFPASSAWVAPAGVLALGFGTHLLALARRPMWWELPIAAGIAFSLLALVGVYRAIHGKRPVLALAAAGLAVGLATASRPTCLLGAAMLVAPLWLAWREGVGAREWWRRALAAAVPLGLCLAAMLLHNYARFESALEFGQNYQLSGAYESKLRHFSLSYFWHNVGVYFFQPVVWSWEFPFVAQQSIAAHIPGYFGSEEVCGLGVTFPWMWLALAVPLAWWRRERDEARRLGAAIGAVAGYFVPIGGLLLCFFSTTERYMADFTPALMLLAACGTLGLERAVQRTRWRWAAWPAIGGAALVTAVLGMLVSFDYHGRMLSRENPEAWDRVERGSYEALSKFGLWTGQFSGPRVLMVKFAPRPAGTVETLWAAHEVRLNERVLVEYGADNALRFAHASGRDAVRWSEPVAFAAGRAHKVELQLPSLHRAAERWMSGLRRTVEFRERSSVAVIFDGRKLIEKIVAPAVRTDAAGGTVGQDFSGRVLRERERLARDDEVSLGVTAAKLGPIEQRGGTLRLRLVLPENLAPEGEPMFAVGARYGSDIIFLREAGEGDVQFCFEHFGAPLLEGKKVRRAELAEGAVEVELPSFNRAAFGAAATGDAIVRVGGAEVLRGRCDCVAFAPGNEAVGRNPFDTTCAREFRGWLSEAKWVGGAR